MIKRLKNGGRGEKMFDAVSYVIGYSAANASGVVEIKGDITCTDDGDANVTITSNEE